MQEVPATITRLRMSAMIVRAMRPRQWTKNILLFAGLFFSRSLLNPAAVSRAMEGFVIFCLLSGAIYLINDVVDLERDRLHPRKRLRPIASGLVPISLALRLAVFLIAIGVVAAFVFLSAYFGMCALAYSLMMLAYSLILKEAFLIDTLIIAMGFTIRAVSGVIVLRTPEHEVLLTPWFVVCVMFLSLLLAFCKRRSERVAMDVASPLTRPVLRHYSVPLMDCVISISAGGAIFSYALYAVTLPDPWFMLTTLGFVLFGIFRYLHLVYAAGEGEAPEVVLTTDGPLISCVVLWMISLFFVFSPS